MKIKYELLYKNGKKEVFVQEAPESDHSAIMDVFEEAFRTDKPAVVKFIGIMKEGRILKYVRISDLSQVESILLEE